MLNSKDNYILVNYHYVEKHKPGLSGIFPCSLNEFNKQVGFLSKNYKIVSIPEIFEAAKKNKKGKFCSITFDDGLRDNYQNAFPILKKHKATASFFIITSTLNGEIPPTHVLHTLFYKKRVEDLVSNFEKFIKDRFPDLQKEFYVPRDFRINSQRKVYDNILTANFKERILSLPLNIAQIFFEGCFKDYNLDKNKIIKKLFMNQEQIKELYKNGMLIGSHSHSHADIGMIDLKSASKELKISKCILEDILGANIDIFSHPHGYSNPVFGENILESEGFKYALITGRRGLTGKDSRFLIPRYDTNDVRDFMKEKYEK